MSSPHLSEERAMGAHSQSEMYRLQQTPRVSISTTGEKRSSVRMMPTRAGYGRDRTGTAPDRAGTEPDRTPRPSTDLSAGENTLRAWNDLSKVNFISSAVLGSALGDSYLIKTQTSLRDLFKASTMKLVCQSDVDVANEKFPKNVTSLMDEQQLWGCFYPFKQLYQDQVPSVEIRTIKDLGVVECSVLTREVVAVCLRHLRRVPLLEDFVYIKLTIHYLNLTNIDVLADYKYLVYLNLQCNLLTELRALSHLPFLQHLDVDHNRLEDVLNYDTPQWYLSEVNYKYNSVKIIDNLSKFWSITVLDLSNNNIIRITGLESLMYLRRLDLSFNHIQRVENLSNLRLLWLDLSYNNISSFETDTSRGLCTLLHLKYLNLNDNKLSCLRIFSGCTRLQDLYLRNNHLSNLLEMAVYMRGLRRLATLDTRGNPLSSLPNYHDVIVDCFPVLMYLDGAKLDPVKQRQHKMHMQPDVRSFATRRLLRLLYVQQLSRARAPPAAPPADSTGVPLVVLVGRAAVGKGKLSRRLASECPRHVELGLQHTTCHHHEPGHFLTVDADGFDQMLVRGELLTYSESYGYSYGLSREQACVRPGKVRLVCMDLLPALMLQLRGLSPLLVLATCQDHAALLLKQEERARAWSSAPLSQSVQSALQVLLSTNYTVYGLLNDVIMQLPDKQPTAFTLDSGCSLLLSSSSNTQSASPSEVTYEHMPTSTLSIYRNSEDASARNTIYDGHPSQDTADGGGFDYRQAISKLSNKSQTETPARVEIAHQTGNANPSKSHIPTSGSSKPARFSKSVSFTSERTNTIMKMQSDLTGLLLDAPPLPDANGSATREGGAPAYSKLKASVSASGSFQQAASDDLWLKFLVDNGLLALSKGSYEPEEYQPSQKLSKIVKNMGVYEKASESSFKSTTCTALEAIHLACPGLFWNTVVMDDQDKAFAKMKRIIRDAVRAQPTRPPLFDVAFPPERYANVRRQLARTMDGLGANLFN